MVRLSLVIALCCLTLLVGTAGANDPLRSGTVRAGVYVSPPFVIAENHGGYSGFAVDLWEAVAKGLDVKTDYIRYPTVKDVLEAARDGEVDIVVLSIAFTYDRSTYLRYSFPWYDSGLRIMVNREDRQSFWSEMLRFSHLRVYVIFFIIFAVMALCMTILRRRLDGDFPRDWKLGFTQSLLDVVASIKSGRLNQSYLGWIGSLISVAWMVFGVAVAAYITSSITSSMTSASLSGSAVTTLAHLTTRKTGVAVGSVSHDFLTSLGLDVVPYKDLDAAARGLAAGEVQATVCDSPLLAHYVQSHPEMPLMLVGTPFQREKYGFVTSLDKREFMDRVSEELIWLYETEKILSLQRRYLDDL